MGCQSKWVPKKLDGKPLLVLDVAERVNVARARPN